ncbi:MAG: hypothetical protein ACRDOU_15090, partial [Streptosporangiaceae bacterium]
MDAPRDLDPVADAEQAEAAPADVPGRSAAEDEAPARPARSQARTGGRARAAVAAVQGQAADVAASSVR